MTGYAQPGRSWFLNSSPPACLAAWTHVLQGKQEGDFE